MTLKKRPAEDKAETDLVSSIYSKTGVQYTHNNSHILARSRIVANGGKVGTKVRVLILLSTCAGVVFTQFTVDPP